MNTEQITNQQEKVKISFKLHTIILLVGPSGSGKTHFSNNYLTPQLKAQGIGNKKINVNYIGSDAIRRELLGDPQTDKMSKEMGYVSHQAFDILYNKLKNVTSYPVNADFVIVDTTGLNSKFRTDVLEIAKENHYNVSVILFDYKNRQEYYEVMQSGSHDKFVASKHITEFRRVALSEIKKKDYTSVDRIKSRKFENYEFEISDYFEYNKNILPFGPDYVIVGDIHGCYDEFVELLKKTGFEIDQNKKVTHPLGKRVLLLGDLIDKGFKIKEVIELAYANIDSFYMIIGNHENYVYKYLKGVYSPKEIPSQEFLDEFFSSIKVFEADQELKDKFFAVVDAMKGFFLHRDFIATHAPCDVKYLGKISTQALKHQRNFQYPKKADYPTQEEFEEKTKSSLAFLKEQSQKNQPFHIFGHIMTKRIGRFGNKLNIDTGCVVGGSLTSAIIIPSGKVITESVPSAQKYNEKINELTEFFPSPDSKAEPVDLSSLEPNERGRVLYSADDKINFISGTVSPSDKDEENNSIETLNKAFEYYKNANIEKVVLQKKFMGSRCNIYLFKDPSLNYSVTRNGYKIKQIDLTEAYKPLYDLPYIKNRFENGMNMILIDSELMPWSAIGKGLIDKEFISIEKAIKSEIYFLRENDFEQKLFVYYNNQYANSDFDIKSNNKSKEELRKEFGDTNYRTYKALKELIRTYVPIEKVEKDISVYSRQLEIFGSEGVPHFKPFSILKEVNQDGTEVLFFDNNNEFVFKNINSDYYLVVDLNKESDVEKARQFYLETIDIEQMEGVMVKPYIVYNKGVAPYLKVRNPRYLTIIYGPDYMQKHKFDKLMKKKSIKGKLRTSIKEFEIGKKMLEIPYNNISKENNEYLKLFIDMIVEEKYEKTLDPRL